MIIEILLPLPLNKKTFYYKIQPENLNNIKIGGLVEVIFRKKKKIGLILKQHKKVDFNKKILFVERIFEDLYFSEEIIKSMQFISGYSCIHISLIFKLFLSGFVQKKIKFEEKKIDVKKNKLRLSDCQKNALNSLSKVNLKKHSVITLHGVTGSGKTRVYMHNVIKKFLKGYQCLILVPEIILTKEWVNEIKKDFGVSPKVYHSSIKKSEKSRLWKSSILGKPNIIVGTRSSLFLPFSNLGLIVVDEEHDTSYKQDEGVIYHARDMAIARASFEKIPIHLVSAIPSLETFNNIQNKKFRHFKINKRYADYPLPKTKIVNLNLKKIKNSFVSDESIEIVKKFLEKGEQVLFFLNRRGYAPYLICKNCGYKQICNNCSMYLTFHKSKNKAVCHHCSSEKKIFNKCKDEKNCDFIMYGPGVEKIYEEVSKLFPTSKIEIFSSDYMKKKDHTNSLFNRIRNNQVDILVGTQMISKGFNFPKLNCIVVIDADFSGRGYDLRTTEKNIQLYNQLSGRAGRFSSESLIVYQTLSPENITLNELIKNNPDEILKKELISRKENSLPPFCRLIAIIISANNQSLSIEGAREIKTRLSKINGLEIMGPVDSPLLKIKKKFRSRLLIRFNEKSLKQKMVSNLLNSLKISSKIKLTVDVDPVNFG